MSDYGRILVTGANGMLARDLCPMLEDADFEVIETTRNELDVTDELQVRRVISDVKPDYVIHCAAYTNVDKAEEEPEIAELVNAKSAEYIAKACNSNNAVMIYISTDYVFDGIQTRPYIPDDIATPIGAYGLSKLHGEEAVRKFCPAHYIIRTSWLYGHHGKNFVETMISLAEKTELKVVDDQVGCPTWTVDLSDAIISFIDEEPPFGTYHACGAGSTSWYGFAKEIFDLMSLNVKLIPCTTEEFPRPAKRPAYSVMDNDGLLRDWKQALQEYIELRVD
ncbi:MAG TPA: dTDP-4-dehydrorhamnose reductase [Candidatus Limenecus avicola]|uniref:dTDP-4-dehydrorhamnose reductase n=1 Tax=Candidatus Limenecus avicola TaxID=2840847 RepID=A0A9D1N156_9CLOT|nr:dTDP-4-dehydrorhamnose reductase [Candidatus Limenecus avicola]